MTSKCTQYRPECVTGQIREYETNSLLERKKGENHFSLGKLWENKELTNISFKTKRYVCGFQFCMCEL